MATFKEKSQRDFRLYLKEDTSRKAVSADFNKIRVGKSTLTGDITAIIREFDKKKGRGRCYKYDRQTVEKALRERDLPKLRAISEHFYDISGIYSRLCRYMAYLYRYDWFVTPHKYDEKLDNAKVVEGWVKSSIFLENCNLKKVFGEIALKVIKYGCYYGLVLRESDAAYLQELPANYCRSRFRINGKYAVEFNIKYFDDLFTDVQYRARMLKMFPKEFQKAYIAYKNGTLPKDFNGDTDGWFLLDPAMAVKFNLGDSDAPLFISVIPSILDLDDAKQLDKDKMAQQLLKIIIQKMPIDKNGDLIFDVDEAQALHNNAVGMVGDAIGVDVLTTFADVDVADLSDRSNVSSVDELERVERTVFNESGTPQGIFNTNGNLALEKSIANDEAVMSDLLYQFADFAQILLSPYNKNTKRLKYAFGILSTTIYNYKDLSKMYKEQTQLGFSKLLPQIAMGHTQSDVIATALFENDMMNLNDLFVPPQMSSTMGGGANGANKAASSGSGNKSSSTTQQTSGDSTGGRPELPDDQKSEKTIQNKEAAS